MLFEAGGLRGLDNIGYIGVALLFRRDSRWKVLYPKARFELAVGFGEDANKPARFEHTAKRGKHHAQIRYVMDHVGHVYEIKKGIRERNGRMIAGPRVQPLGQRLFAHPLRRFHAINLGGGKRFERKGKIACAAAEVQNGLAVKRQFRRKQMDDADVCRAREVV